MNQCRRARVQCVRRLSVTRRYAATSNHCRARLPLCSTEPLGRFPLRTCLSSLIFWLSSLIRVLSSAACARTRRKDSAGMGINCRCVAPTSAAASSALSFPSRAPRGSVCSSFSSGGQATVLRKWRQQQAEGAVVRGCWYLSPLSAGPELGCRYRPRTASNQRQNADSSAVSCWGRAYRHSGCSGHQA